MENLHNKVSFKCSQLVTNAYSSSFSSAIKLFSKDIQLAINNIYAFVRFADEIVDTFHDYPKKELLDNFVESYHEATKIGISLNPIIHSFVLTKKKYNISEDMVNSFLESMYKDLEEINYTDKSQYDTYIYGSAEVVGLMCLKVFTNGNEIEYKKLENYARSFGAALQKINFLRDIKADFVGLNRTYFPMVDFKKFSKLDKNNIEKDIQNDFIKAKIGIDLLPKNSRLAVLLAYKYYINLFRKIKNTKAEVLVEKRIRISNMRKLYLFMELKLQKQLLMF